MILKDTMKFACVLGMFAFLPCLAFADAHASGDIAEKIQQYHHKQQSFSAKFTQVLTHRDSGSTEKRSGQFDFKKPQLIFWQTEKPKELLVVSEKEILNYLEDENLAYKYPLSIMQESQGILQVLTGQVALNRDFDIKVEKQDQSAVFLRIFPKNPSTQLVEALIEADLATGAIRAAEVTDFYGNTNAIRFSSYTPNKSFPKDYFQFKLPAGTDIENITDPAKANLGSFK